MVAVRHAGSGGLLVVVLVEARWRGEGGGFSGWGGTTRPPNPVPRTAARDFPPPPPPPLAFASAPPTPPLRSASPLPSPSPATFPPRPPSFPPPCPPAHLPGTPAGLSGNRSPPARPNGGAGAARARGGCKTLRGRRCPRKVLHPRPPPGVGRRPGGRGSWVPFPPLPAPHPCPRPHPAPAPAHTQ